MRVWVAMAMAAMLSSSAAAGQPAEQPKPWETLGITEAKYRAIVDYAGALGAHAYFVGACERFYDRKSTAAAVASMTGVGEGDQGKIGEMLSRLWTQSYAEGRLKADEFDQARCKSAIDGSSADVDDAKAALAG